MFTNNLTFNQQADIYIIRKQVGEPVTKRNILKGLNDDNKCNHCYRCQQRRSLQKGNNLFRKEKWKIQNYMPGTSHAQD